MPVLVVAGPGSGKTRVLTYRVAWLLHCGEPPSSIIGLTFTNRAADEMKSRVEKLVGVNARQVWLGTFHSLFARILRREAKYLGYTPSFSIYDTEDTESLLKTILKEKKLDKKQYHPGTLRHRISLMKNSLITPQAYMENEELLEEDQATERPHFAEIYQEYVERCKRSDAMDFDDLLLNTYLLFENFPDVLLKYQMHFRHVLIDEFQDTNPLQYEIAKRIAVRNESIFCVGDDAQSIYSFRGASVKNMFDFMRDFPEHLLIRLTVNYRSTKTIVRLANSIIRHNKIQIPKELTTENPQGRLAVILRGLDEEDEARRVVQHLFETLQNTRARYDDFAILYRVHAQSRPLEEHLRRLNIPYHIFGSVSFFQRKEIKDALAYLRVVLAPNDEVSLVRIINLPPRGIGATTVDKLQVWAKQQDKPLWHVLKNISHYPLSANQKKAIEEFVYMIESLRTRLQGNAYPIAREVLNRSGLLEYYRADESPEGKQRYLNLEELLSMIKLFDERHSEQTIEEGEVSLAAFLRSVTLITSDDIDANSSKGRVHLMTIHSAKGLEFRFVYIVGMEEGILPHGRSCYHNEELEEERRIFYVAATRAKEQVVLSYAGRRFRPRLEKITPSEPSRFLFELDPECVELLTGADSERLQQAIGTPVHLPIPQLNNPNHEEGFSTDEVIKVKQGDNILHSKFGKGIVLAVEGEGINRIATIQFEDYGTKKIMLRYAKIKRLH